MERAVIIEPGCICHCTFCNPLHPNKFSIKDINKMENEVLKNIDFLIKNNISDIEISGCDPANYYNLPKLIKYISEKNVKTTLSTHGITFSNYQYAKELVDNGLNTIRIPIYGHIDSIHERITRTKNSFRHQIKAIENFLSLGTKIIFHTLITQYNKDLLSELLVLFFDLTRHSKFEYSCIEQIVFAMPAIASGTKKEELDYYLPYRDLGPSITRFLEFVENIKPLMLSIIDVPYCLVGKDTEYFYNNEKIEDISGSTGLQLPQIENRYKEDPTVPNYRLRKNLKICDECSLKPKCSGFFVNDLKYFSIDESKLKIIK